MSSVAFSSSLRRASVESLDRAVAATGAHDAACDEEARKKRARPVFSGISGRYLEPARKEEARNKRARPVFSGTSGRYLEPAPEEEAQQEAWLQDTTLDNPRPPPPALPAWLQVVEEMIHLRRTNQVRGEGCPP